MIIESVEFPRFLARRQGIPCLSVVYGDDVFFRTSLTDALRNLHKKEHGVAAQRFVFNVTQLSQLAALDWELKHDRLLPSFHLVELRCSPRFLESVLSALIVYRTRPVSFVVMLDGLSWQDKKSRWFSEWSKKDDVHFFSCALLSPASFRRWAKDVLSSWHLVFSEEVFDFLCSFFEGNALGFVQAVEQWVLCFPSQKLTLETVHDCFFPATEYRIEDCIAAIFSRDQSRFVRVFGALRETETSLMALLLWCFARDLRICGLCLDQRGSSSVDTVLQQQKVFGARRASIMAGLRFFTRPLIVSALSRLGVVDQKNKGLIVGDPWDDFFWLGYSLSRC